jgi:hypothetical protein
VIEFIKKLFNLKPQVSGGLIKDKNCLPVIESGEPVIPIQKSKAEEMVDDMTDIEVWKEIVAYYTQGEVTTTQEAREWIEKLFEDELE